MLVATSTPPNPPPARALPPLPPRWEVEARVTELVCVQSGLPRAAVRPGDRLVEDLGIDSLDLVELVIALEEEFAVRLDDECQKAFFTGRPDAGAVTVRATAELVLSAWGTGESKRVAPPRRRWFSRRQQEAGEPTGSGGQVLAPAPETEAVPFTQPGIEDADPTRSDIHAEGCLHEPLGPNREGYGQWRRARDGMRCVLVPASAAGGDGVPVAFLMDAEPVSAGAYVRFLNAAVAGGADADDVARWCGAPEPRRAGHFPLVNDRRGRWRPFNEAVGRRPMVLVSWFGAAAYALWAHGRDWRQEAIDPSDAAGEFLPSEAQWEHAARGGNNDGRAFPWGDEGSALKEDDGHVPERVWVGRHRPGAVYADAGALPAAEVNARLGMSPVGLHHMAGNVWQWCRGWFGPGVRPERGGSWVGPPALARCSYRRGRPPTARGRCLGFRCAAPAALLLAGAAPGVDASDAAPLRR